MEKNLKHIDFNFDVKNISDDDNFFTFEGLASTFEEDLDGDIINPGAFSASIQKRMPVILYQHNVDEPVGVTDEIRETREGLFIKARMPKDDSLVSGRIIPQMRVGSLSKMSIGFRVSREDMQMIDGVRNISKVDLHEISIVTFPANPGASIQSFKSLSLEDKKDAINKAKEHLNDFANVGKKELNNLKTILSDFDDYLSKSKPSVDIDKAKSIKTKREFESILRESGAFSKSSATLLASMFNEQKNHGERDDMNASLKNIIEQLKDMNKFMTNKDSQNVRRNCTDSV